MHLSIDKTHIHITPKTLDDIKFLREFPGFYENKCPAIPQIGLNLVKRLVNKNLKFTFDPEVKRFIFSTHPTGIPEGFVFQTPPLPFQELALSTAAYRDNIAFLLDPGLGKTKVALDWLWMKGAKRVVCVCPSPLKRVWVQEIAKHRKEFRPYVINTTILTTELEEAEKVNANFLICSYRIATDGAGFLSHWQPDALIVDESLIKNPSSQRTHALTQLSKTESLKYRALLSGTLINNDPSEVFAPVRFLEPSLFGNSKTNFDREYFILSRPNQNNIRYPISVKETAAEELRNILRLCSIIMRKEEYLSSLPPKNFYPLFIPPSPIQEDLVNQIVENRRFQFGDRPPVIVKNQLTAIGKLLQVENSFYYEPQLDDELDIGLEELFLSQEPKEKKKPSKTEIVYLGESPKANALTKLAMELGNQRGIIWFNYRAELPIILAALKDPYVVVDGKTKDPGQAVEDFNNDPEKRWLVAQARVLNYGVTVLGSEPSEDGILPSFDPNVHLEIFMSLNFSYEVLIQQQDRIHRIGQKYPCDYYFLLTDSRGERRVWEILQNKEDIREFMLASCLGPGVKKND